LRELDGELIDLRAQRGKVVLLNFWTTWCPPCVEEIPSLGRLAKRLSDHPFRVISIDVGEEEQQVRDFLKEVPADFPVLMDPDGTTIDPWKIRAFPTSFVIDREGRMRYGYYGGLEWDDDEVVALIEQLLQE
jgi:thiol-disulfide isomerase/thioredoxin